MFRRSSCLDDRSFTAAGLTLRNSLPIHLQQPDLSLGQFRRALKTHQFVAAPDINSVTYLLTCCYRCLLNYYASDLHREGALRNYGQCMSVCLSVTCLRITRERKGVGNRKLEVHHRGNPWTYLVVRRLKVKVRRPVNAVTDIAPYADRGIRIFLKLSCFILTDSVVCATVQKRRRRGLGAAAYWTFEANKRFGQRSTRVGNFCIYVGVTVINLPEKYTHSSSSLQSITLPETQLIHVPYNFIVIQ